MNSITIIQADRSHATRLANISLTSFREAFEKDNNPEDFKAYTDQAFNTEQILRDIEEPGSIFYMAYLNNEIAGYARVRESTEVNHFFPGKNILELHRLYALHKHIGKGIGKALITHCLSSAKEKGVELMWLGVWEHNLHAQQFYNSFGFERFSSHVFMVGNDPQTDFLLKKNL